MFQLVWDVMKRIEIGVHGQGRTFGGSSEHFATQLGHRRLICKNLNIGMEQSDEVPGECPAEDRTIQGLWTQWHRLEWNIERPSSSRYPNRSGTDPLNVRSVIRTSKALQTRCHSQIERCISTKWGFQSTKTAGTRSRHHSYHHAYHNSLCPPNK
jgi:hypothetical protein